MAFQLGCELVLAAEFCLTDIAGNQLKNELIFELGGENPTRTRHRITPELVQ